MLWVSSVNIEALSVYYILRFLPTSIIFEDDIISRD